MPRIDWQNNVRSLVLESVKWFPRHGVNHPTIGAFYYQPSDTLRVIPGTEYGYKKLDALTVKMRKSREIPFGFFSVERGKSFGGSGVYWEPEMFLNHRKRKFVDSPDDYSFPRWYKQPKLAEVWVEGKGLGSTFRSWTRDLEVEVRANEGYGTWEFIYGAMSELACEMVEGSNGKDLVIYYLGDLDPSGTDIDRALEEAIRLLGLDQNMDIKFERLAVNPDQVREYSLPDWPERRETIEKMEKDSRCDKYLRKFGKRACELDSFVGIVPDKLRRIVRKAVEENFDPEIYERTREEES